MRRYGKRIVAISMAAAMMASLPPQAMTFLQQEIVYAAEQTPFFTQTGSVSSQRLDIPEEDWGDKKEIKITESVTDVKAPGNFDMTAEVALDEEGYQSLKADPENFLKIQGVEKIGAKWTWTDSQDIPYLTADSFKKDGDVYKTDITIKFRDKDSDDLKGVYFEVIAKGFQGIVTISNTKMTEVEVSQTKETVVYTCSETKNADFDFSRLTAEDWDNMPTVTMETGNDGLADIAANAVYRGKVTIDQAVYQSLGQDGAYIKLQTVMKLGDKWSWTQGGSYPELDKNAFTANGDGTYSASFEDKYSDIAGGALHEVIIRAVGLKAKGSFKISDVTISNVVSKDAPLESRDPVMMDDFESAKEQDADGWKNEAGWKYDNVITPVVETFAGSKALKLNLDYSKNAKETWSEAKVSKYYATGFDISAYNQLTYDLIVPDAFTSFSMKVFAKNSANGTTLIDKEGSIAEEKSLGNGYKKIKVQVQVNPSDEKLDSITIGTVGKSTSFAGNVYIDNIELSQNDPTKDYVEISETAGAGTQSKALNNIPAEVKIANAGQLDDGAKALYAYLKGLSASDQVLFGHQNDVSKKVSTTAEDGDVKEITGSVSGMFGIDSLALIGTEADGTSQEDALKKSVAYSKKAKDEGAILTLSMHMPNFTIEDETKIKKTGTGKYDFHGCDFKESKTFTDKDAIAEIMPGGDYNDRLNAYLDIIADYAKQMAAYGDTPIIFRPYHENTGNWFWWGSSNSAESYKSLYRYTRDYLTAKGVKNMLYVYSPGQTSKEKYEATYPGDEYVDILAFDCYDDYNTYDPNQVSDGSFFTGLDETCKMISAMAKEHGKVAAISETGVRAQKQKGDSEGLLVKNNPVAEKKTGWNWYQKVNDIAKKNDMPYYMVWANFEDTNFYVPYKYNDKLGQEMINEFIRYYNNEDSVFGNGTDFYTNTQEFAKHVSASDTKAHGYMISPFDLAEIVDPVTFKASVTGAKKVSFVVKGGEKDVTLDAKENGGYYTAEFTKEDMEAVGKTDTAIIELKADGVTIASVENISVGKVKDKAPSDEFDSFDYYSGSDGLLGVAYPSNSASGCDSYFTLDKANKVDGTYGGAFHYKLKTKGTEVWTGNVKTLANTDYSEYDAMELWVKLDGKGQKVVVQLNSNNEDFEVFLNNLNKTAGVYKLTIPFKEFKGKTSGKGALDPSNITKFGVWCNSIGAVDVESTLYFDGIKAVKTSGNATKVDADGFVIASSQTGGGSSSSSSSGSSVSTDTGKKEEPKVTREVTTKKDGTKVETITTENPDGSSTVVVKQTIKNTEVTVNVKKDTSGKTTATAEVKTTIKKSNKKTKISISPEVVNEIVKTAGTKNVVISQTVRNAKGEKICEVQVNAKNLKAGAKLVLVKVDPKTGKQTLVDAKTFKVSKNGNVNVSVKDKGTYVLLDQKSANKLVRSIKKAIQPKDEIVKAESGDKIKVGLDTKNKDVMDQVKEIQYRSSDKAIATVDKKGNVTLKSSGKVTIEMIVTLKNGQKKKISTLIYAK